MRIVKGCTRWVFLLANHAVKIPSLCSWKQFLTGLLANAAEREWSGFDARLAPVCFSVRGGWVVVMRRYEEVTNTELEIEIKGNWPDGLCLELDMKPENFGRDSNGRMVVIDYGS